MDSDYVSKSGNAYMFIESSSGKSSFFAGFKGERINHSIWRSQKQYTPVVHLAQNHLAQNFFEQNLITLKYSERKT